MSAPSRKRRPGARTPDRQDLDVYLPRWRKRCSHARRIEWVSAPLFPVICSSASTLRSLPLARDPIDRRRFPSRLQRGPALLMPDRDRRGYPRPRKHERPDRNQARSAVASPSSSVRAPSWIKSVCSSAIATTTSARTILLNLLGPRSAVKVPTHLRSGRRLAPAEIRRFGAAAKTKPPRRVKLFHPGWR